MSERKSVLRPGYGGYLEPWADEILEAWRRGIPVFRIAMMIQPKVDADWQRTYHRYPNYPRRIVTGTMIKYVLKRLAGVRSSIPKTPEIATRRYVADWAAMFPRWFADRTNLGRPLDIDRMSGGGPRDMWIAGELWQTWDWPDDHGGK